jgi:hypothetical protein
MTQYSKALFQDSEEMNEDPMTKVHLCTLEPGMEFIRVVTKRIKGAVTLFASSSSCSRSWTCTAAGSEWTLNQRVTCHRDAPPAAYLRG